MIDITGVDLVEFAQKVYELSSPQGYGVRQYVPGSLSSEEAQRFVLPEGPVALSMDYVRGRTCKMCVWREEGKLTIGDSWYDHTDRLFRNELLAAFDIIIPEAEGEHNTACNCMDCQSTRAQREDPEENRT